MQLVAYGAQDIYLTGNPQITFFKVVYRRHTNFAMECVQQTINGNSNTASGGGNTGTVTISRNGDLVGKVYVTSSTAGIEDGDSLISEVEVEIGGQRIDRHYKEWLQVWAELSTPDSKALAYKNMTGALSHGLNSTGTAGVALVQVPLQFWFCRNPGLALPLIALQYHEVKLKFTWGDAGTVDATCEVWADYIYLDTDERRRFAQVSHEYLIEQVQREVKSSSTSQKLNFNHPVKELIWAGNWSSAAGTGGGINVVLTAANTYQLKLNGHDRFAARDRLYFTRAQVWQHHTGFGGVTLADTLAVYSFALKPEEHQPSGTCNFSRIDNAQLVGSSLQVCASVSAVPGLANIGTTGATSINMTIFAVNYNVLRIMSGMGGLAYSN